jgi:ribosomal protein S18 acetylase RimI-like enzyme
MSADSLDQLFSLYHRSFPASEIRSEASLRRALQTPAYRLLTHEENGQLLGFAILYFDDDCSPAPFALLEYLAVEPYRQGQGIGKQLVLRAIVQAGGRMLITELDSASPDPNTLRRQKFYESLGFSRIEGLDYLLPLPGNPPPMELWVYPDQAKPIARATLAYWLTSIYVDVYGCPPQDPRIAKMLGTPLP